MSPLLAHKPIALAHEVLSAFVMVVLRPNLAAIKSEQCHLAVSLSKLPVTRLNEIASGYASVPADAQFRSPLVEGLSPEAIREAAEVALSACRRAAERAPESMPANVRRSTPNGSVQMLARAMIQARGSDTRVGRELRELERALGDLAPSLGRVSVGGWASPRAVVQAALQRFEAGNQPDAGRLLVDTFERDPFWDSELSRLGRRALELGRRIQDIYGDPNILFTKPMALPATEDAKKSLRDAARGESQGLWGPKSGFLAESAYMMLYELTLDTKYRAKALYCKEKAKQMAELRSQPPEQQRAIVDELFAQFAPRTQGQAPAISIPGKVRGVPDVVELGAADAGNTRTGLAVRLHRDPETHQLGRVSIEPLNPSAFLLDVDVTSQSASRLLDHLAASIDSVDARHRDSVRGAAQAIATHFRSELPEALARRA